MLRAHKLRFIHERMHKIRTVYTAEESFVARARAHGTRGKVCRAATAHPSNGHATTHAGLDVTLHTCEAYCIKYI